MNRPLLKRIKKDVEHLDETTDAVDEDKIPEVVSRVSSYEYLIRSFLIAKCGRWLGMNREINL